MTLQGCEYVYAPSESVFLTYSFVQVGVCGNVESMNVYIIMLKSVTSCQTCQ